MTTSTASNPGSHLAASMLPGPNPLEQIRRTVAAALFDDPVRLTMIGRFQVLRLLGVGGMGAVYAARDPKLDRTVALKLLHLGQPGAAGQERLLREAQAMARLQHPNVLAVHDVGTHNGQVYIAMEYVEGGTLGEWLRAAPRHWSEVLDLLLPAGRGLAAAHTAGMVHRDFKPANVLLGGGRPRIADFGLASLGQEAAASDAERTMEDESAVGAPLTRTGTRLGTPAYMAPEQLAGAPATGRSDQFAFCIVLFEAIHGHRPFHGASVLALRDAIEHGALARATRPLPRPLRAAIARGLDPDPEQRFPDMDTLLNALALARRPRTWTAAAVGTMVIGVAAGLGLTSFQASQGPSVEVADVPAAANSCDEDPFAEVWNASRERQLREAFSAEMSEEIGALARRIDSYGGRWRAAHRRRCDEGQPGTGWTGSCLEDRRRALDDLLTVVLASKPATRHLVADVTEFLPDVADCAQASRYNTLTSEGPGPLRRIAWGARLQTAGGYAPEGLKWPRLPEIGENRPRPEGFEVIRAAVALGEPRVELELELAVIRLRTHEENDEPNSYHHLDRNTGEEQVHHWRSETRREWALRKLRRLASAASAAGYADVAAYAWVTLAELLEAGPHTDEERANVWRSFREELTKLPPGHLLGRRLLRTLAYVELGHARHSSDAGRCHASGEKFDACEAVLRAIDDFETVIAAETDDDDALRRDLELVARAHEQFGDIAAANAVRGRVPGPPLVLDERALEYLDLRGGMTVPAPRDRAEEIRCTHDFSRCELDPQLLASEFDPSVLLWGPFFSPSLLEGESCARLLAAGESEVHQQLDLRNTDCVIAVDGIPVGSPGYAWQHIEVPGRGRLLLTIARNGVVSDRELVVRLR